MTESMRKAVAGGVAGHTEGSENLDENGAISRERGCCTSSFDESCAQHEGEQSENVMRGSAQPGGSGVVPPMERSVTLPGAVEGVEASRAYGWAFSKAGGGGKGRVDRLAAHSEEL